jgi:vancomycin permeability regulator SanA
VRTLFRLILLTAGAGALILFGPRLYTDLRYGGDIFPVATVRSSRVAIVFGAGITRRGSPTPILYDRVATAADLYLAGKVDWLLLSGTATNEGYSEPLVMARTAQELGVPESALVLDGDGARTYDTCYRAQAIYGVSDAILVTQRWHLPRALYLCDALGLTTVGVASDRHTFGLHLTLYWNLREVFATLAAWWDVTISHPLPALGEPTPIL